MDYKYDANSWPSVEEGEKNCFLLTNGLGGFCSLTLIGSVARGDQALLMAAKKAPNVRRHVITNIIEEVIIDEEKFMMTSQRMGYETKEFEGYKNLYSFTFNNYPTWVYKFKDVEIKKSIVMVHEENTVGVYYDISNPNSRTIKIIATPLLRDTSKNDSFDKSKDYTINYEGNCFSFDQTDIYVITNGDLEHNKEKTVGPMFFSQDKRDGRNDTGFCLTGPSIIFSAYDEVETCGLGFSTESKYHNKKALVKSFFEAENERRDKLSKNANLKSDLANDLLQASDAYLVNRESINGKSIIAGYPFFEDWGRDTMISLPGICLTTRRFKECRQILETFAKYEKKGLLPNLFPEGDVDPMYNSVDAPLLFINTVYEYVRVSFDTSFIKDMYPVMEDIIYWYKNGTDFHIKMDEDGLIMAGEDLEQLTWMDVRVNGFLPTPRHGKPVEINAYWYSALKIMEEFSEDDDKKDEYNKLAKKVKESFLNKFWNEKDECLKDVLSGDYQENQIRPNQVWSLTLPFTIPTTDMEEKILFRIREELFTTAGLRTLSPRDENFKAIYIGDMEQRDRAYHQGTVWTFPLGAYYRACLKHIKKTPENKNQELFEHVRTGLEEVNYWLKEGCVNQLAEIYDGLTPTISRGCFAQAWSVGEILRAVDEYDNF